MQRNTNQSAYNPAVVREGLSRQGSLRLSSSELLRNYNRRRAGSTVDDEEEMEYGNLSVAEHVQRFFYQDYSNIEGLIQNLTIMAALVATLGVTMVTIVELPEFPSGNTKALAMSNRGFRCNFAPDETLDLCTGTIDCSDGDIDAMNYDRGVHVCKARKSDRGCKTENLQVGYDLASSIDVDLASVWIESNYYEIPYDALPSKSIAANGFYAVLCLMTSLFVSVFLYVSLVFSHAREDPKELRRWWFPIGALGVFGSYTLLLYGCVFFFQALQEVVAIRFPFYQEYGCMVEWNVNFQFTFGGCLVIMTFHHMYTRVPSICNTILRCPATFLTACTKPLADELGDLGEESVYEEKAEKEKKREEKIGPVVRAMFTNASQDMVHCVPLFEKARITPSQMDTMDKKDFLDMGLCVGDALRVEEILKQRREKAEKREQKRFSRAVS
jgi:hypothetical protein